MQSNSLPKPYLRKFSFKNQEIIIESNKIAQLADKSFLIKWNKTTVLATVCVDSKKSTKNWLPLSVDFQENLYATGRIPGSFFRREGKPSDFAVLSGRMIDRSIRNLFPKNFRHEVQIIIHPLSVDYSIDLRVVGLLATSLSLNCGSSPFSTLIAGVIVGFVADEIIINPTADQLKNSEFEMFLAGSEEKINMIELSANQTAEEKIFKAIEIGHQAIKELISLQKKVLTDQPPTKKIDTMEEVADDLFKTIEKKYQKEITDLIEKQTNYSRDSHKDQLFQKILTEMLDKDSSGKESINEFQLENCLEKILQQRVRDYTLANKKRIDGRSFTEIRPLQSEVDLFPIVHGSGLFARGLTQTISIVTLGTTSDRKLVDNITQEKTQTFMHHYKSLPYSFGQSSPIRGVSRRETGHGQLGQKALKWILPSINDFPYTIRVVSEVMSSNGSTSQASICSASLALMAAGVPIKNHLAGTATGLIKVGKIYHLLTDMQAWEDFYGDMDFKISGSKTGITSIQIDLKIDGLPLDIIKKIFDQAKIDRTKILETMSTTIEIHRSTLAESTLKFAKIKVDPLNISSVIGPGGKNIRKIIADTADCAIDVEEDGTIWIFHKNMNMIEKAKKLVLSSTSKSNGKSGRWSRGNEGSRNEGSRGRMGGGGPRTIPKIGEQFHGTVDGIAEFGAFIELPKINQKGLIHISLLAKNSYVKKVSDVLNENDKVLVEVVKINEKKQIGLKLIKKL